MGQVIVDYHFRRALRGAGGAAATATVVVVVEKKTKNQWGGLGLLLESVGLGGSS
jgi:hypothetical protein